MAFAIPQTLGKAPSSLGSFKTLWMINCRFPYRLSCRKHIYWTPVCNLITSVKNEKVKLVRALANTSYRRTSKKIVCEGLRLVSDALKRGLKPDFILYSDDVFQSASFRHYFSEQLFATPVAWKTTHDIMASLSDSVTCQGIIAVFEQPCDNMPSQPDLVLVCDRLQDPGNLGSLLRSAAATGVDGVIISPDSTDPYSVKVLRGGMGAHFAIPIKICEDWKWFLQVVQDLGISLYLADSNAEQSHYQLDLREPLAVIVSSEAHGPSTFVKQLDAHRFKIPMRNAMESLNVAVAGSVFLYEVLRQREEKSEMKIGIVGFGNFGQFLAKTFVKQGHKVIGTSRSNYEVEAKSLGALYVPTTSDLMEQDPDVVVFCTSITSTRSVVESFPVDTLRGKLVVDVLSVKVYPKKLLLELLPQDADILCTHPMFGPESGRYSWKGLPFVYEQVRISDQVRCETFLGIFSSALCTMIPMSSELHDSYAASSQFITHTTGRMLAKLNLQSTPINTKGYESLLGVVETTCKDSFDLYYGLYKYNPNAKLELEKMEQALQALRKELETREALDAPNKD